MKIKGVPVFITFSMRSRHYYYSAGSLWKNLIFPQPEKGGVVITLHTRSFCNYRKTIAATIFYG